METTEFGKIFNKAINALFELQQAQKELQLDNYAEYQTWLSDVINKKL